MLCGTNRDGVYRGCWRLRRLEMLEGVGDCPVQGHGSGLGGPAARAAIGGSLPCRGEGAASFGGGAGGPTRPRWASTSARPFCATGSAFELSAWRAAATTTLALGPTSNGSAGDPPPAAGRTGGPCRHPDHLADELRALIADAHTTAQARSAVPGDARPVPRFVVVRDSPQPTCGAFEVGLRDDHLAQSRQRRRRWLAVDVSTSS